MCGICGVINHRVTREQIDTCCDALTHRGPDGRGVWMQEGIALAHRRLAILDLTEEGHQPMSYANGRYWITFNGEVYNYIEIRNELKQKGYSFRSNCDTEVILASFCEWGDECVNKFNGMWTFAIYDTLEKSLFISRDRFGIKPLYYMPIGEGIAFGSEMKALTPLLDKIEVNYNMINFYKHLHHYEFKDACLVKNIKRFPAGHNGYYKNGKFTIKRYWNTLDNLIDVPTSYEEQCEMFRELFLDSCRIRMRSDVTIGTSLSGGLDSSAVICAMSEIGKREGENTINRDWQHAYVAGFNNSPLDETKYARMVTNHLNINDTYVNISGTVDLDEMMRKAYLFEELWMNSQIPMMKIYENERKAGTVVSIDGHGADELLAGYVFNMQYSLLDKDADADMIAETIFNADAIENSAPLKGTAEFIQKKKKLYQKTMLRNEYEKFYRRAIVKSDYCGHPNYKNMDNLNKSLFIETHEKILPTLLRNYDRDSMASGVEIRMPFMDYRLVSFVFSIPGTSKVRNGFSKAIVRDSLQDLMPKEIAYRKDKKGFNAPLNEWMRDSKDAYLDLVHSGDFLNSNLVDNPKKVQQDMQEFIQNKNADYKTDLIRAQKVWNDVNLYVWEQGFVKGKGI